MSCIFPVNLPYYSRNYPRYWGDRTTSFWWDMLISRILNEGCYKVKIFLNWARIRVSVEIPFFCTSKCFWPHIFIVNLLITIYLPPRFLIEGITIFKVAEIMSWSLSLSGDWISRNWLGRDVLIKSKVFFSVVEKWTNCSKWWSFKISMNFSPSDRLNGEPDLLSLSGQTMSQKLKSPRIWTEGSLLPLCIYLIFLSWLTEPSI